MHYRTPHSLLEKNCSYFPCVSARAVEITCRQCQDGGGTRRPGQSVLRRTLHGAHWRRGGRMKEGREGGKEEEREGTRDEGWRMAKER